MAVSHGAALIGAGRMRARSEIVEFQSRVARSSYGLMHWYSTVQGFPDDRCQVFDKDVEFAFNEHDISWLVEQGDDVPSQGKGGWEYVAAFPRDVLANVNFEDLAITPIVWTGTDSELVVDSVRSYKIPPIFAATGLLPSQLWYTWYFQFGIQVQVSGASMY